MNAPWLSIVGIGDDGLDSLSATARTLLDTAEIVAGGARHLAMLPADDRVRLPWSSPMDAAIDRLLSYAGTRVCLLATGDPMHWGIGATLVARLPHDQITVIPAPSAFALVTARMGWPRTDVTTLSIHGRPIETLHSFIQPGAKLAILTSGEDDPARIAALLTARGFGPSPMTLLERMGGQNERRIDETAESWRDERTDRLNTIAVDCRAAPGAKILPRIPGLPDSAYRHDGQLTKSETRAVTLSALAPGPGARLWDIGAGCGSISIEWLRAEPTAKAYAIERQSGRISFIQDNAAALGVPHLEIIEGEAPEALADLPQPDAVFVGGGAAKTILDACWQALSSGGRLVCNAVTLETEGHLANWYNANNGEMRRISVSRLEAIGDVQGWRPFMEVTQLIAHKP